MQVLASLPEIDNAGLVQLPGLLSGPIPCGNIILDLQQEQEQQEPQWEADRCAEIATTSASHYHHHGHFNYATITAAVTSAPPADQLAMGPWTNAGVDNCNMSSRSVQSSVQSRQLFNTYFEGLLAASSATSATSGGGSRSIHSGTMISSPAGTFAAGGPAALQVDSGMVRTSVTSSSHDPSSAAVVVVDPPLFLSSSSYNYNNNYNTTSSTNPGSFSHGSVHGRTKTDTSEYLGVMFPF